MKKVKDIIEYLEKLFPPKYACQWDNNGLHIGSPNKTVAKIVLTLNSNLSAIKKALKINPDLIISHHPLFFHELKKIDLDSPLGKTVQSLIASDTALYCAHTNMDAADQGINYHLAIKEGLIVQSCKVIEPTYQSKFFKLVVFVPQSHCKQLRTVLANNGAGHLGNYSHCDFVLSGLGHFKPLSGSNPYSGQKKQLSTVAEDRIETIITEDLVDELIPKMIAVHPYEEPAFDLYPLSIKAKVNGLGLIGTRKKDQKTIAVCSGSGGSLVEKVATLGAEEFITGEANYHQQLLAEELGLKLILKGHYQTEAFYLKILARKMCQDFSGIEIQAL